MIRSFVSGILVGGVVSALTLAVVSYVAPPKAPVVPASQTVVTPDAPAVGPDAPAATPSPAAPQPVPDAPAGAVTPAPVPAAPAEVPPVPKTESLPVTPSPSPVTPATGSKVPEAAPLAPAEASPAATSDEAAAEPAPASPAPAEVAANGDAATDATPPAAAPLPQVAPAPTPLAPAPPPEAIAVPLTDEVARAADAPGALAPVAPDDLPVPPAAPVAPPKVATGSAPPPAPAPSAADPLPVVIAEAEPVPVPPGGQPPLPKVGADVPPPAPDPPPTPAAPKPRILTEDTPPADDTTATLAPEPRLDGSVDGVVTGRLPRIGAPAPPEPAAVAPDGVGTPLERYARSFENPDQKPLFSIILIDAGAADLDRKALANLPFPVSFALDPMDPAAPANAAIYRAAGQEVLMLATGIPDGAIASDLEVSFAALGKRLPQAVAVLDQPVPVFQDNRPLATQVVPILAAQGRGLVTWDAGLNAADQVARRDGLPSATAFRYLDGDGENADTVRRYLDRAAFRAAQEGRVVVIGQTRPETVEALLAWALEGRSASVALAPISAVLTAK